MGTMRWFIDTMGGLCVLLVLAARSGFRLRGPYWRWRAETAFGPDRAKWPPTRQRLAATLAYGRWVYRMKRGR